MNKSSQYNPQSKSKVEEIYFYHNMESGRHSIYIWKQIPSGLHARKNPEQECVRVVTFSDPSFNKKCIYVYDHAAYRTHWTDHPVHKKILILVSKLGLFVLEVTQISNLPIVCLKLIRVGGWV